MARRKEPTIPDPILDQLLGGADAKTAFDPGGLLDGLKKALAERMLNAEMEHHLDGDGGAGNGRMAMAERQLLRRQAGWSWIFRAIASRASTRS